MTTTPHPSVTDPRSAGVRVGIAFVVSATYCLVMLVRPGSDWPAWVVKIMSVGSSAGYELVRSLYHVVGVDHPSTELAQGAYLLLVSGLAPLLAAMLILRARPSSLGCRRPNRFGWRLLLLGFILAMPFLFFMARGGGMQASYLPAMTRAGTTAFIGYYAVNMLTEHFFFHGVLLAALRPTGRWPAAEPSESESENDITGSWPRLRRWLGIGLRHGEQGENAITAWLGLAPGCGFAIFASASLFALVHVGKDWREAVLSFPGGVAIAYVAYRSDSWLIPFLLHSLTAGTTLVLMMWM